MEVENSIKNKDFLETRNELACSSTQMESSTSQVEISAVQMKTIASDFKVNLMNNILKASPYDKLDLMEENVQKPVVVNKLQGQTGNQYYVFTDEQKLLSKKLKKQQTDSEDEEETKEKFPKREHSFSTSTPPNYSTYKLNEVLIVSIVFAAIIILYSIKIFYEGTSFIPMPIHTLILFVIAVVSCFAFIKYRNEHITDRDLQKNASKLKEKYKQMDSCENFNLWYDNSCDIPFENYVINLEVVEDKMLEYSMRNEVFLLEEIFAIKRILSSEQQFILVTGKLLSGKTTLIRKLACDWSTKKNSHYLSHFDILIVIQLKELGNISIVEAIAESLLGSRSDKAIEAFMKSKLNFLVLLDEYDNVIKKKLILDFLGCQKNKHLPKMTVIVTSNEKISSTIKTKFDWHFSLIGFTKDDQLKYIGQVFADDFEKEKTMKENYLEKLVFLEDLAKCPLMMNILCSIHKCEQDEQHITVTSLYIKMVKMLIRRYGLKYGYNFLLKKLSFIEGEKILFRLGKILFENLIKNKRYILEEDIKKEFVSEDELELISQLDIIPVTNFGDDIADSPFHQMLIEFIASFYLYNLENKSNKYSIDMYGIKAMKDYFLNYLRFNFLYGMKTFWEFDKLERDLTDIENLININKSRMVQFPADMEIFQMCRNKISEERFARFCSAKADLTYNIIWDSVSTLREVLNYNQVEVLTIFLPVDKEKWKRVERDALHLINSNPPIKYVRLQLNSCPCYVDEHKKVFVDLRSLLEAAISSVNIKATLIIEIEFNFKRFKKISRNFRSENISREEQVVSLVYFALNENNKPPFSLKMNKIHLQFRREIDLEKAREMIVFISSDQVEAYSKYSWWRDMLVSTLNWEVNLPKRYTLQIDNQEIVSIL